MLFNRFAAASIDGFGLDHAGIVSLFLLDFFGDGSFIGYTAQQKIDVTAFLLCFDTGTAPAVGYTITVTADNVANPQIQADWTTLQQQAAAHNIDLIVRGTINGQVRGLLYRPFFDNYITDFFGLGPLTRGQLGSLIAGGDTLTLMGVYPGTGRPQALQEVPEQEPQPLRIPSESLRRGVRGHLPASTSTSPGSGH